ncbi:MAG: 50S ribosomal protein L29, partial [Ignavibacteria bacterium]|nr:50S ribosomal protein L29 [Ignavibacteria bacterium]
MKAKQVREMSVEDLNISLKENFEALENFRFRLAIGQLENYKSIPNTKKDIARMYTMLREKDLKLNENMSKEVKKKDVKKTDEKIAKEIKAKEIKAEEIKAEEIKAEEIKAEEIKA